MAFKVVILGLICHMEGL